MAIPRNDLLKITIYAGLVTGAWPLKFQKDSRSNRLYNCYFKLTYGYFLLFILSAVAQLLLLLAAEETSVEQIMVNICVTLPSLVTFLRVLVVRSVGMRNLIEKIFNMEDTFLGSGDKDIIKIYRFYARQSQVANLIFVGNIIMEATCYLVHALYTEDEIKFNPTTNETTVIKALPLSSWFPYDPQDHYLLSYLWQIFDGSVATFYFVFIDVFSFSTIIFILGQIRILIHILSNFPKYVLRVMNQLQCSREEASFVTFRECVLIHQDIIRFQRDYNDSMKFPMLLDFLQSSVHLASLVMQLFMNDLNVFNIVMYGQFIFCMVFRLLVYYWYANEIMVESNQVAGAIYESNWYDEPEQVKQMMIILILRANKTLGLDIGPFGRMTLQLFIGIFPRNDHFKVTMYANSLLGVWPYIFEGNPILRQLYNIYSKFTFSYFIFFILTAIIELFILITDDEDRIKEIVANLCITLLYLITAMRVWAMRGTTIRNLIKEILAMEEEIFEKADEEIVRIYKYHARHSQITNLIFIVNITIETVFYFTHPLYVEDIVEFDSFTNDTSVIKALPLSSWFPYDRKDHYLLSYLWQILDGVIGASYVMYTDAFNFSLIIYPLGQIRILAHVLSNFPKYVANVKDQIQCSQDEASFITMRECILKHKEIIRYLQEYNGIMKNIMLLDFLQSSLQLASIVIQFFVTEVSIFDALFYGEFAICMLIRLLIYYWYANEIMVESRNISAAVCACRWYEEPQKVKQMMLLVVLRANKAMTLDIGPFTTMTLSSFLGIIKATYSYMMVMTR